MARSKGRNHRNGGHHNNNQNNSYNNNNNNNNRNNNNSNSRSNRNTNNTRQECTLCGSTRHHQSQCIATGEEKKAYDTYKTLGHHGICIHCGKQGSHLPSNCFKRQNNNRNNTGDRSCGICKKKTNHELGDCPEARKWLERADRMIEAAFTAVPYCLFCGNAHKWQKCNHSSKGRRLTEFRNQAKALLIDWIGSSLGTDFSLQNISFCGYCESFCDHNTTTCTESVEEYQKNEQRFLLARFGKVPGADNYDKLDQKPMKPLVEKKCQLCHTVLPKVTKPEGYLDHNTIVHCINPRCGKQTVLLVDDGEDGRSSNSNTWGRKNSYWADFNAKGYFARALGYAKEDCWPFFAGHTVTCTAKGQPYYDGDPMTTALARLHPSKYHNNGLWTFNDPGNFQPFFPPASCQFERQDIDASNESNNPIKHTRNGLIPFCIGCGLWGAVVDDDYDIVMTQSGSDMEGNLAGAGTGVVVFENPHYRLGERNSPGETHYIARGQCGCTIRRGVEPNVVWKPLPPVQPYLMRI